MIADTDHFSKTMPTPHLLVYISSFPDKIQISYELRLKICDKLYGHGNELLKLKELYACCTTGGKPNGTIIGGELVLENPCLHCT